MIELLTVAELAARLRVRPRTVQQWARRGRIPTVRLSAKVIRFNFDAVLLALQSRSEEVQPCNRAS
jgi:excisionase family DNA binding protein